LYCGCICCGMGTIGDAPGAARFLELGADMKKVLEDGRFLRSGEIGFEWIGYCRCLILLGLSSGRWWCSRRSLPP
jgi:hypothetical protein